MDIGRTGAKKILGATIEAVADHTHNPIGEEKLDAVLTEAQLKKARQAWLVYFLSLPTAGVIAWGTEVKMVTAWLCICGAFNILAGIAILKPGVTKYSYMFGWKARVVGAIFLLLALI